MIRVYNQFDALEVIESLEKHFSNAKEKTLNEYLKTGESLLKKRKNDQSISDLIHNTSKEGTFYKRVNSIRYFLCRTIKDLLDIFYETQNDNLLIEASDFFRELEEIANFKKSPEKVFLKATSKKSSLRGLPADWVEKFIDYNPKSKYRTAFLTMSLSGCRPSELVRGVEVSITEKTVSFLIAGSKVDDDKGQPFRTITYLLPSDSHLIAALLDITKKRPTVFTVFIESAVNITTEIRRIGEKLWEHKKDSITSYCFRHQLAANLKKTHSGDDVSRALGHCTNKTRKRYGHHSQARGISNNSEIVISATRPIKNTATHTFANFLSADESISPS
jgi:integrase